MRYDWSKERLSAAAAETNNYHQMLSYLEIPLSGGNHSTLKMKIRQYEIDTAHFLSKVETLAANRGPGHRKELLDILVVNSEYTNTHHLKNRLWKEGLLEKKCSNCDIAEWMGKEAPLQLDHINGVRTDNRIENLRILCANCHAQTETWCSKNRGNNG